MCLFGFFRSVSVRNVQFQKCKIFKQAKNLLNVNNVQLEISNKIIFMTNIIHDTPILKLTKLYYEITVVHQAYFAEHVGIAQTHCLV